MIMLVFLALLAWVGPAVTGDSLHPPDCTPTTPQMRRYTIPRPSTTPVIDISSSQVQSVSEVLVKPKF